MVNMSSAIHASHCAWLPDWQAGKSDITNMLPDFVMTGRTGSTRPACPAGLHFGQELGGVRPVTGVPVAEARGGQPGGQGHGHRAQLVVAAYEAGLVGGQIQSSNRRSKKDLVSTY